MSKSTEEIESWLLTSTPSHTLKLVPQSQRELFASEMARHIHGLFDQELKKAKTIERSESMYELIGMLTGTNLELSNAQISLIHQYMVSEGITAHQLGTLNNQTKEGK